MPITDVGPHTSVQVLSYRSAALVRGDETRSYGGLLDHGARVANALREAGMRLLVTIGAERPPGSVDFDELVTSARSVVQITARADGDLAIVGCTSGTTGLPKGAMISQWALTDETGAGKSS